MKTLKSAKLVMVFFSKKNIMGQNLYFLCLKKQQQYNNNLDKFKKIEKESNYVSVW